MRFILSKFALVAVFFLSSVMSFAGDIFPGADWQKAKAESVQIDRKKLKAFADYTFTKTKLRKTDALLVIRGGKIVFEKYAYGYSKKMRHLSWSMSKSFTAVLMGIAEADGLISRESKVKDAYPFADERITLFNLLTMSSGIRWDESYSTKAPLQSDVIQMLYMNPREDMAGYVASRGVDAAPGERYAYSTGDTTLAMGLLKYKMPKAQYDRYPWLKLFDRIGMKNVVWEQDQSGTFMGGSNLYATARDYARFGYLLLKNGKWNGERVLNEEWIKILQTLSPSLSQGSVKPSQPFSYGTGFWLNAAAPKWEIETPFPKAPSDTYFALGHNGQSITIIPSKDLIVVRLAHDEGDEGIDLNEYFGLMSSAAEGSQDVSALSSERALSVDARELLATTPAETETAAPLITKKHTSFVYFTKLLAAARARDFCSCRFVVGQSVSFCKDLVRNGFPLVRMSVNEKKKIAKFGILPRQRVQLKSETLGCSFL